jgi:hypothetical protein
MVALTNVLPAALGAGEVESGRRGAAPAGADDAKDGDACGSLGASEGGKDVERGPLRPPESCRKGTVDIVTGRISMDEREDEVDEEEDATCASTGT